MYSGWYLNWNEVLLEFHDAEGLDRLFFLYSDSEEDAAIVYQNATYLKMTGEGFVWLVTQQTLSGRAESYLPQGDKKKNFKSVI